MPLNLDGPETRIRKLIRPARGMEEKPEQISIGCTENLNAQDAKGNAQRTRRKTPSCSLRLVPLPPVRLILFSFLYAQLKCALEVSQEGAFQSAVRAAKIEDLRFHDLPHIFTMRLRQSREAFALKERPAYSHLQTTVEVRLAATRGHALSLRGRARSSSPAGARSMIFFGFRRNLQVSFTDRQVKYGDTLINRAFTHVCCICHKKALTVLTTRV